MPTFKPIEIEVSCGYVATLNIDKYPVGLLTQLIAHGARQKMQDSYAATKADALTKAQKVEKAKAVRDAFERGEWGRTKDPVLTKAVSYAVSLAGDEGKIRSTLRNRGALERYCKAKKIAVKPLFAKAAKVVDAEREAAKVLAALEDSIEL